MEAVGLGGYSSFPWVYHLLLGTRKLWDARRLVTFGPHRGVCVFPLANWGTCPSSSCPPQQGLITFPHLWSRSHCSCQWPLFQHPSRIIWHLEDCHTVPCFINRMKATEEMFNFAVKMPSYDGLWGIQSTQGGWVLLRILKPWKDYISVHSPFSISSSILCLPILCWLETLPRSWVLRPKGGSESPGEHIKNDNPHSLPSSNLIWGIQTRCWEI